MTAAYYLALKGYGVTVFEALPVAGGMMMLGIPRYRLPREVIDRETAMLEELGVEFRFNTRYGKDITLEGLKAEGYDAFFLAIGAHHSFKLNIPGETDYPQVIESIDLLRRVALGDRHIPGKHAVIVGGGNVAIDAARTCLRLGSGEVTIAYRRTRAEMPADVEEVEQAEDEGIHMSFLTIPKAVVGKDGRLTGLECIRAKLIKKDDSERLFPVPVEGSDFVIAADTVVSAIGQRIDHEALSDLKGLKWTRRQTIQANTVSMETSIPGVFAGGDAVTGPATVVEAIGAGKRAAEAIDRFLSGIPQPKMPPVPVRRTRVEWMEVPASTKMTLRAPPHHLPAGGARLHGERRAGRGPALPALRHLPALRQVRRGLPGHDGHQRAGVRFPQLRHAGGHRLPRDRGALHPLRRLRRQLPEPGHPHRRPGRRAPALLLRDDPEPPEARALPGVRRRPGPAALPGIPSETHAERHPGCRRP